MLERLRRSRKLGMDLRMGMRTGIGRVVSRMSGGVVVCDVGRPVVRGVLVLGVARGMAGGLGMDMGVGVGGCMARLCRFLSWGCLRVEGGGVGGWDRL